jgi:hypothetical protein
MVKTMEYKEAIIEQDTVKVYYEYYDNEKENYQRFYVNEPQTNTNEICKTVNRALFRGYNPYEHEKNYKTIKDISSIKVNVYFLGSTGFCVERQ